MANVDNPRGFEFVGNLYGGTGGARALKLKTANAQTIAPGDAVILNAGYVQIALANSGLILGVAASGVTGSAQGDDIWVIPAMPGFLFRAQCSGTLTQALLLKEADIEGATGVMEVNEDATVEGVVQIVDLDRSERNALGANADVIVRFIRTDFGSFAAK